jgi:DMATS type aromatic prenyltransferase
MVCLNHDLGGEFNDTGILGKLYFFPSVRSAVTGTPTESIVGNCMSQLGVGVTWDTIIMPYFTSLPKEFRPIPDMVSVDCLAPSRNRVKVYFRAHLSTLNAITEMVTLGDIISDEYIVQTVSTLQHLWGLFFPGVAHDTPLPTTRKGPYYPSGFLIYYEMVPGRRLPIPKVYIPVRHYCRDDAQIAAAISHYFKDTGLDDISERYTSDLECFL